MSLLKMLCILFTCSKFGLYPNLNNGLYPKFELIHIADEITSNIADNKFFLTKRPFMRELFNCSKSANKNVTLKLIM